MAHVKHIFIKFIILLTFLLTLVACAGSVFIINDEAKMLTDERLFMGFSPWTWMMALLLALTLCAAFWLWVRFSRRLSQKGLYISTAVLFTACALLYVVVVCNFQSIPTTDSYIVQDQALVLAKDAGSVIDTSIPYFARYANNNLLVILLGGFFRLLPMFGISNYYLSSIILNAFCLFLSEVLLYLAVKKLFGTRFACNYLFLSVLSPVMYLTAPWVYSVSLCMPFVAALVYLGVCLFRETRSLFLAAEAVLFAVTAVVGYFIRPIVAIFAIAFFLCFLIWLTKSHKKRMKSLLLIACCVCISVPSFFCINGVIDRYYLDDSGNFPMTHWVMMGLHTNGSVNARDQQFTAGFQSKEEKTNANMEEIKNTLQEYGVTGLAVHLAQKHCLTWSEGSADYTARIKQNAEYPPLYDYIAGDRNDFLLLYCQAFRLALYLLVLLSLAKQFFSKRFSPLFLFVLSLFGGMLFYLVWEAKQSYCIPFLFLLAVLAAHGLDTADLHLSDRWGQGRSGRKKGVFYVLSSNILLGTVVFGAARYDDFTQRPGEYRDISILCCNTSNLKQVADVARNNRILMQVFYTEKPLNTVELQVKKQKGGASYQVTLTDSQSNTLLCRTVGAKDIQNKERLVLSVPETQQGQGGKYTLEIKKESGEKDSIGWAYCFSRESDLYKGTLLVNTEEKPYDLMLDVYRSDRTVYAPPAVYIGVFLCLFLLEFLVLSAAKKRLFPKKDAGKGKKVPGGNTRRP